MTIGSESINKVAMRPFSLLDSKDNFFAPKLIILSVLCLKLSLLLIDDSRFDSISQVKVRRRFRSLGLNSESLKPSCTQRALKIENEQH